LALFHDEPMPMNPWITNSFLDSCAFDPKYHPEDLAATELFRLHQTEHLRMLLAHSNKKEVDHPNTPPWVKTKVGRGSSTTPWRTGPGSCWRRWWKRF
jgi:hypothetical protein